MYKQAVHVTMASATLVYDDAQIDNMTHTDQYV